MWRVNQESCLLGAKTAEGALLNRIYPMNKSNRIKLADLYLKALKAHLGSAVEGDFDKAHQLGETAVQMGMETLQMAKIHDQSMTELAGPDGKSDAEATSRAVAFFNEVVAPIEKTHLHAKEAKADLADMEHRLGVQTEALADSNRELQQQAAGRGVAEAALKSGEEASAQLLRDSRLLEAHLQDMARKILAANEVERKKMSLQLQDEIAQTLLGIHVRLIALKKEVKVSQANVSRELAMTQRLISKSVTIIKRLAKEFGNPS